MNIFKNVKMTVFVYDIAFLGLVLTTSVRMRFTIPLC